MIAKFNLLYLLARRRVQQDLALDVSDFSVVNMNWSFKSKPEAANKKKRQSKSNNDSPIIHVLKTFFRLEVNYVETANKSLYQTCDRKIGITQYNHSQMSRAEGSITQLEHYLFTN